MKAIINGLRYDTEKAELIGSDTTGGNDRSDFRWRDESLYRTPRSKRYFLAGRGGPMTRYARGNNRDGYTGGSGIIPLSAEDALQWAERELRPDQIEAAFGDAVQDA